LRIRKRMYFLKNLRLAVLEKMPRKRKLGLFRGFNILKLCGTEGPEGK